MWGQWENTHLLPKRGSSPDCDHAGVFISEFQSPELWEISYLQLTQSMVVCYQIDHDSIQSRTDSFSYTLPKTTLRKPKPGNESFLMPSLLKHPWLHTACVLSLPVNSNQHKLSDYECVLLFSGRHWCPAQLFISNFNSYTYLPCSVVGTT